MLRVDMPRITLSLLAHLLLTGSVASAQEWLVITATVRGADPTTARQAATSGAATVGAATSTSVMTNEDAVSRIDAALSRPFEPLPPGLAGRLAQTTEAVLNLIVSGRRERAARQGSPLMAEIDPVLPAVGRDDTVVTDASNLCLYIARAQLEDRNERAAREQMIVCSRLFPSLIVDEVAHPPSIRSLHEEVRLQINAEGGVLSLQSGPGDPAGCALRVNGRVIGQTPSVRIALPAGDYSVQAECREGRPGRIQHVRLTNGATERLVVYARLGQVLETRPVLALVYDDNRALDVGLQHDVALLARMVHTRRVLVVADTGAGSLATRAYEVSETAVDLIGSAQMSRPIDDNGVRGAIENVLGRRNETPVAHGTEHVDEEASAMLWPGVGLATAGVITLGIGWGFELSLESSWNDFDQLSPSEFGTQRFSQAQRELGETSPVLITAALGAAFLTTSLPMWLPEEEGVPWWSWVAGTIGVGLGAWGIYDLVREPDAIGPRDALETTPATRGTLVLGHALPLLAVPLIYLFRPNEEVQVSAHLGSVQLLVKL